VEDPHASPEKAAQESAALDDARELLRARLDDSRLFLEPIENPTQATAFDPEAALAAMSDVAEQSFRAEASGSRWRASSDSYVATFDRESGRFELSGTPDYQFGLVHADDALFYERARTLLSGLAPDVSEQAFDLEHLGASTRTLGDPVIQTDERMGSKVFVLRSLGGLRVAGNRLVASFATDGRLVSARGLWPTIDLAHSQLDAALTLDEARERALDLLVAHGVNPNRTDPIVLESFYQLEPGPEGMVARIRAAALVVSYNHEEQPGRRERHEFEL
jgi:hypothetical protein